MRNRGRFRLTSLALLTSGCYIVTLYSMRIPLIKVSSSNLPPEQARFLAWFLGLLTKVHTTPGPFVIASQTVSLSLGSVCFFALRGLLTRESCDHLGHRALIGKFWGGGGFPFLSKLLFLFFVSFFSGSVFLLLFRSRGWFNQSVKCGPSSLTSSTVYDS